MFEYIDDYYSIAKNLLITQFKGKPNFEAFLNVISQSIQSAEDALNDLYTLRSIEKAYGAQLNGIGQILGLARNGLPDEDYRSALKFQAFINSSKGEPEVLLSALKEYTKSTNVKLYESFPAKCYGYYDNDSFIADSKFNNKMDSLCMGGVKWVGSTIGNDQPFILDEPYINEETQLLCGGLAFYDQESGLIIDDGTCGKFTFFVST